MVFDTGAGYSPKVHSHIKSGRRGGFLEHTDGSSMCINGVRWFTVGTVVKGISVLFWSNKEMAISVRLSVEHYN